MVNDVKVRSCCASILARESAMPSTFSPDVMLPRGVDLTTSSPFDLRMLPVRRNDRMIFASALSVHGVAVSEPLELAFWWGS